MIRYNRTYFKPKTGGKKRYPVDELVGIEPRKHYPMFLKSISSIPWI